MAFLSATAQQTVSQGSNGAANYLSVSKIEGSVRIRILDKAPVEYWEVWGYDPSGENRDRPFRFTDEPSDEEIALALGDGYLPRETSAGSVERRFNIAFTVYNYSAERIQVCAVSQKTVQRKLDEISQKEDYEILSDHDLEISRKGEGIKTVYDVVPLPRKKSMDTKIQAQYLSLLDRGYDITRMTSCESPFPQD